MSTSAEPQAIPQRAIRPAQPWTPALLALCLLLALAFPGSQAALAAGFTVDRTDDDPTASACTAAPNDCSLRGAIIAANVDAFADTITLPAGTYTLDEVGTGENSAADGDLDVHSDLTINGAGEGTTIIDGNGSVTGEGAFQLFGGFEVDFEDLKITGGDGSSGGIINFATLDLTRVTLQGNQASGNDGGIYTTSALTLNDVTLDGNSSSNFGGGIYVHNGTLTVHDSTFTGNLGTASAFGGAIAQNAGTITIEDSYFELNDAYGGGAISSNGGMLLVYRTTFHNNSANTGEGGAIYMSGTGSLTVEESTFSANTAATGGGAMSLVGAGLTGDIKASLISGNEANGDGDGGGGIRSALGGLTVSNSTLSGNSAKNHGGGLFSYVGNGNVELNNVTISDNSAASDSLNGGTGGGIYSSYGDVAYLNTIIAGNDGAQCDNLGGTLTSMDYNLSDDGSCNLTEANDLPSTPGGLAPLADNGGPTLTHALLPGSAAIDAALTGGGNCPSSDQRGVLRPIGAACDIGAFEAPIWTFLPVIVN